MKIFRWHLRILTASTEQSVELRIKEKVAEIFCKCTYTISQMHPYWKFEGWGEIDVDVQEIFELAYVKSRLAEKWDGDVADRRWTGCFDDAVMFLWFAEGDS